MTRDSFKIREEDVDVAVVGWIKHRLNIRSPEMSNIMQYVRFAFIKQEYLVSTVRNS